LCLFFYSCNKDENVLPQNKLPFSAENQNGILIFKTVKDYENAVEYYKSIDIEEIKKIETSLEFNSLRNQNNYQPFDNIIASLLNCNKEIIIADKIFTIDMNKEIVSVKNINMLKNESATMYSTKQDVLQLVFNEKKPIEIAELKDMGSYYTWPNVGRNLEAKARVCYFKAGIYFWLVAEIETKKINILEGYSGSVTLKYRVLTGGSYEIDKLFGGDDRKTIPTVQESGKNTSYKYQPYNGTRPLNKYYFPVEFSVTYYKDSYLTESTILSINK